MNSAIDAIYFITFVETDMRSNRVKICLFDVNTFEIVIIK